jgi:alpha-N-arabinofuranosidase
MMICRRFVRSLFLLLLPAAALSAQMPAAARLTIDTAKIVSPVSPTLYGLMTEEINHSYDGGLYAQMLSNPTLRNNWAGTEGWGLVRNGNAQARAELDKAEGPSAALPTSLKLRVDAASPGNEAGLSNAGYWGLALRGSTTYRGSFYAKAEGDPGPLTARLIANDTGKVLAEADITLHAGAWSQYQYILMTGDLKPSENNHFELTVAHPGTLWIQLATLMPPTYHGRSNGNRPDLMEKMAAMHPHFLRLPGGNYLEGDTPADWYNWRKTVGPLVDRPGHQAPWGYWSTDGLGLLEFLEWCEDLKIEPVLAVYAGYALKGNYAKPGDELAPYVQAAVEEVEYVTGDAGTKWGAERAKDGHPAPFPLHYIEIGNEDQFDHSGSYDGRFAQIARALRKAYPQVKLIATTPVKETEADAQPDVIDDHYYESPAQMFDLVHRYDAAPRNGPKIFVGEWATRSGSPTPNFGDALGDAAWMTSLERNSDLIVMASYAPLLVNVNPGAMQWATDLIGYDALTTYGSPSFYAQCLFGAHIGDGTPQATITGVGPRFFYSATVSTRERVLHLKLVNATGYAQPLAIELRGLTGQSHTAQINSLHGGSYAATNSITVPDLIKPLSAMQSFNGATWQHTVPALTIEVIDVPLR